MPQHLATIDLAMFYHERYWIEHGYQQMKEELGIWLPDAAALTAKKKKSIAARANWLQKKSILASDAFF